MTTDKYLLQLIISVFSKNRLHYHSRIRSKMDKQQETVDVIAPQYTSDLCYHQNLFQPMF